MKTRIESAAVLLAAAAVVCPRAAVAHAFLDHADPKVGATVEASPQVVTVRMTQEVEPSFSTLKVFDADGKQVDKGDSKVDEKDKTTMTVSVPTLAPGTYKVEWKVTSADTHKTHGSFTFTVKAKG